MFVCVAPMIAAREVWGSLQGRERNWDTSARDEGERRRTERPRRDSECPPRAAVRLKPRAVWLSWSWCLPMPHAQPARQQRLTWPPPGGLRSVVPPHPTSNRLSVRSSPLRRPLLRCLVPSKPDMSHPYIHPATFVGVLYSGLYIQESCGPVSDHKSRAQRRRL